ncbi:hypothetical protein EST38_g11345 [Candolleomyces aberdarensis]|uniref:Uncharacterized protein n=1 Tax=Candolleomyces aberdarensis TaxID=2316362 RepID=A0A4V1Q2B5_9AGAR|nr:hypothetical protein EST38_g11345 [Candolleomyces aberdarensis]
MPSSSAGARNLYPFTMAPSSSTLSYPDGSGAALPAPKVLPLTSGNGLTQPPPLSQPSHASTSAVPVNPSRSLAVPLERRWMVNREVQKQKQQHEKTGKELQKEMDDTKRRSVTFVIYHTANEELFCLQVVVKTWPQLRLQDFPK